MERLTVAMLIGSLVLAIVGSATRPAEDDEWVRARSANFDVISNAGPELARRVATDLERFRSAASFSEFRPRPGLHAAHGRAELRDR